MDQQTIAILTIVATLLPTAAVGVLGFFLKRTLKALESADEKNATRIREVEKEVNDLKADMPLLYVTREDYIRVMNRVEEKLDRILYSGCAGRKEE